MYLFLSPRESKKGGHYRKQCRLRVINLKFYTLKWPKHFQWRVETLLHDAKAKAAAKTQGTNSTAPSYPYALYAGYKQINPKVSPGSLPWEQLTTHVQMF